MATITAVKTKIPASSCFITLWETMGDADTGTAVSFPDGNDKSVQIIGTFGSATVTIQGSNDGATWASLTDPQGNAIAKTAAALEAISEHTRYIRAITSGGTGTDVDVYLFVKGQYT